jgi:hypothetical protein
MSYDEFIGVARKRRSIREVKSDQVTDDVFRTEELGKWFKRKEFGRNVVLLQFG